MKLIIVLALLALLLSYFSRWGYFPHRHLPGNRVRSMRLRLRLKLHPGRGHATLFELWLRFGRFASWRESGRSRRSLSAWERARHPNEHSVLIGHAQHRAGVRLPVQEHCLLLAPPRSFKTALLSRVIQHWSGPCVATSTKDDLYMISSGIRAQRGSAVSVFNPMGIGDVLSNMSWDPVRGCEDPETAIRRADGFAYAVSMKGADGDSFWSSKASDYLRAMFHAAAIIPGGDLRLVARWALSGNAQDAEGVLWKSGARQWAAQLAELRGEAQKTVGTVRMVISRALGFMSDPSLMHAVIPGDSNGFDIEDFLRRSGTLYLVAESRNDDSPLAPLFAALVNEITFTGALMGSQQPGGRLDPPLLVAADEISQVCPIPLPSILADAGGKGIAVYPVCHGEAQLRNRWGADGAQTIMDTCGTKVLLGGIADSKTLEFASKVAGQVSLREKKQEHHTQHAILTEAMIRELPRGYALVLRGSCSPVVAKLVVGWKSWAYRKARRAGTTMARLAPALGNLADGLPWGEAPAEPPVDGELVDDLVTAADGGAR